MKKILISLLAVAGVLSACDKIEKVKLPAEDDIVPPVLKEAPATIAVTEDNGDTEAVFVFELADFKQKVAASYSLFAVYGAETKSVISLSNTGEAKVTYTAFNKGLMTAFPEIIAGKAFDLEVKVGVTVGNTFSTIYSNSKTINVTTVALQERETNYPDYKDVSTWGLTGSLSAYDISWNGDVVMYTNGTKHLAENVEINAGEEFKFRKDGKWDLAVGSSTGENFTVTLGEEFVGNAEPGSKNLLVPEYGKFDLFLDPETNKILVIKHGDKPAPEPEPEPVTYSHTFVLGDFGLPAEESAACYPAAALTDSFDDIEWTLDSVAEDGRFFMFVTEGWMAPSIQVGYGWSGAGDPSSITLSTSDIGGTITKIVARYVTFDEGENDGGKNYIVSATVGGEAFGTPVQHVNEAPSATFEGEASGEIVITWTQNPAFCTCFLKGIDVTYIPAE